MTPEPRLEPEHRSRPSGRRSARLVRARMSHRRLLRAVLLVVLIAGIGVLAAMLRQGRSERGLAEPPPATPEAADAAPAEAGALPEFVASADNARIRAERFESTLEREGVEVFRIRGAQTSSDDEGNVALNDVDVDYPRGDDSYSLTADSADYNETTNATRIEGSVALRGTNGLMVDTEWMDLARGGMVLRAADGSRFTYDGVTAVGNDLRMDFRLESARLRGGVELLGPTDPEDHGPGSGGGQAAPVLRADTLVHRWGDGVLLAQGGVEMQVGDFALSALSVTIDRGASAGADTADTIVARGGVVVRSLTADGQKSAASDVVLRGTRLDATLDDAGDPRRVTVAGSGPGGRAELQVLQADGSKRVLGARLLEFDLLASALTNVGAHGRVEVRELPAGAGQPSREATSESATGRFGPDGAFAELLLSGKVELVDHGEAAISARAEQATLDAVTEQIALRGSPAVLVNSRGKLEGRGIVYDHRAGCARASGGRTRLVAAVGAGDSLLPTGGSRPSGEPAVVAADEARVCNDDESRFLGQVEVTQGTDLLAAELVQTSGDRRRLVANGGVRTVWQAPAPESAHDEEPGGDSARRPEEAEFAATPWTIAAARLDYDADVGEVSYSGAAEADLGDRRMACDELTVGGALPKGETDTGTFEADRLICVGNARFDERGAGRSALAERLVYRLAEGRIVLYGNVRLREAAGELRAPGLVYGLEQGRYEIGRAAEQALAGGAGR